ncbi:MAG: OmpP1/FadL family transporter [Candidatus Binatia bacterium]
MRQSQGDRWKLWLSVLISMWFLLWPSHGQCGQLLLPAAEAEGAALGANVVALPLNPVSALFHNPAQLTLLPNAVSMGTLAVRYHPRYANPLGYDSTSRELPVSPSFGYKTDRWAPWHVGVGMYGALGFTYNHDADPARGVPDKFFTELAIISLAPAIAYSLKPNLHFGFEINPSYGRLKFKTPSPVGKIDVDVRGPGVFGTLGVLYSPTSKLNIGVAYKTPGSIFMFGNARVAGRGDDAYVKFQLPQTITLGMAYKATSRLTFTVQGRWAEFSVFEDTRLEFDERRFLNRPAANDARDRLRLGAGIQYVLFPGVTGQLGFSWEQWAIKANSLSPNLPDLTEYFAPAGGVTIRRGAWRIGIMLGYSYVETRRVSADRNPFFPGRYSLSQTIGGLQITRLLGESAQPTTQP